MKLKSHICIGSKFHAAYSLNSLNYYAGWGMNAVNVKDTVHA